MSKIEKVLLPDIGGAANVDVIEILVKPGDQLQPEDPMVVLEGDKATMEVPSPLAGTVKAVHIKVGDKVSQGALILDLEVGATGAAPEATPAAAKAESKAEKMTAPAAEKAAASAPAVVPAPTSAKATALEESESVLPEEDTDASAAAMAANDGIYAGPGVRRLARELGIDLKKLSGTGAKNRIVKEDIQNFVKSRLSASGGGAGLNLIDAPSVDFTQFGEITSKPLSKIKKISGANLHRNWVSIPHVTQFDEADITEMEAFRQQMKTEAEKHGVRLTPLVFIMKAVVKALQKFPSFNASLDKSGEQLILKNYFHLGVAVDTPNGLVVPVIRDVDKKSLLDLAKELADISTKAREKGLSLADMQGGCFTISSLGGIGGTAFTPIINAPEVAILGVSKAQMKPIYQDSTGDFKPRLMLPLSLSYDHRVIDGAEGARFSVYLASRLADIRTLLL